MGSHKNSTTIVTPETSNVHLSVYLRTSYQNSSLSALWLTLALSKNDSPGHPLKCPKKFCKKSKNTENWWKKGENLRILTGSESKKFKFYILDIRYEKKFGGYFLKKTPFSTFWGLLVPVWNFYFQGPNTLLSASLKPWSKKSYLYEYVF